MENSRIQDIPSIKKTLDDAKQLKMLKTAMPIMKPLLQTFGVNVDQIEDTLSNLDELERQIEELAAIPDRFNDIFGERGWIIYDLMNLETAKAAIARAESGCVDDAEEYLVEYYNAENLQWLLRQMIHVNAFIPRMRLAEKALIDYREERYHACVPVILALLDGLVSELHEKRLGFFAEDVTLEAWDSVAAHVKGLNELVRIFQTGRRTTRTEQISVPYRNGILHGMDLGYDNKMVAAKTWAALFATRDWALKAEKGLLSPPPAEQQKTWIELAQQIRTNAELEARLKTWEPRIIRPGIEAPTTGAPDVFVEGTPERRLVEFLHFWKAGNYGQMAQCLSIFGVLPNAAPARVRESYGSKKLKAFEFLEVTDGAPAMTTIKTRLRYEENGGDNERTIDLYLVNKSKDGSPAIRSTSGSSWRINEFYI